MTSEDSSQEQNQLRVSDGDTIYIEYDDITLPNPYTQADSLEIVATAVVMDTGKGIIRDTTEFPSGRTR